MGNHWNVSSSGVTRSVLCVENRYRARAGSRRENKKNSSDADLSGGVRSSLTWSDFKCILKVALTPDR